MQVQIDLGFDDYIALGDKTTHALLEENGPLIRSIKSYYKFFSQTLWADTTGLSPVAGFVSMNAFMCFLSGVRIAMTGHANAIHPLLRTALESACYAFLMVDDPKLEEVWINRDNNRAARQLCRNKFSGAVSDAAKKINKIQPGSGDAIAEAYDIAIKFGAHPNVRSIIEHISDEPDKGDDFHHFKLAGLYSQGSFEITRGLIGCLEYAFVISVVLARCLENPSVEIQDQLSALNSEKELILEELVAQGEINIRYPNKHE
jgi:hypothetical protein